MEPSAPSTPNNNLQLDRASRIQVSHTKRPLYFYVRLAKRMLETNEEVTLSALASAIASVVTIAEILRNSRFAVIKKIETSTTVGEEGRGAMRAKMSVILIKSAEFHTLFAAEVASQALAHQTAAEPLVK
eukprot:gnl/Spiro4/24060_TR11926_c0_g1_i1.p1 gnl/Spiro4/24060_TR11926_c0_g1~~gnl/Spiro4/24060_TR11926_c0_g1_i1.p1  ORF type:complete len:141 (+),score=20.17 gnl/Spiro4/24060_TR11926_c0_g1_i1:35-424(+)